MSTITTVSHQSYLPPSKSTLKRWVYGLSSLLLVFAWLLFSYWQRGRAWLPNLAFQGGSTLLQTLALFCLIFFILIQGWVLFSTTRAMRQRQIDAQAQATQRSFTLSVAWEFFWTLLPILMTLALAWWGADIWKSM